jgi:hypothetical protein
MRIWKLTPVDPADQAWTGYNTKPMLVRAESANKAQDLAQYETLQWRTPTPTPSHKKEFNPWVGYKTRCEDVTDTSGYSVDGPAEVLK